MIVGVFFTFNRCYGIENWNKGDVFFPLVDSKKENHLPENYDKDEFPLWLQDLRRGEIIFFGSIPFTLFFSFEFFDLYRYFTNEMNPAYNPWPFRSYNYVPYTDEEKIGVLIASLSASLSIAIADYFLGKLSLASEKKK